MISNKLVTVAQFVEDLMRIEQRPASLPNLTNEHSHNALGKSQKNHWHA